MKLNLSAPINKTSFGYWACYTLKYLKNLDCDIRLLPIGNRPDPENQFIQTVREALSHEDFFFYDSTCLKIWHPFDFTGMTGKYNIGCTVFELEDLSQREAYSLKYLDKVIVPTKWAADVCLKSGISASVVPLGYEPSLFTETENNPSDETIFANFGKWEIRKGHDILIKAFNAAFEKDDNVSLVMMPHNFFLNQSQIRAWEKMYKESKLGEKIQIIPRLENQEDVFNVMKQVNCGVFPARAEGWNLEALELMGCGKDVIITNCTGHTEFVDESCQIIKMKEEFETAFDDVFFKGFSKWRSFSEDSFDQLVEKLRFVHNNRNNRSTNHAAINRAQNFTWEKSIVKLLEEIKEK